MRKLYVVLFIAILIFGVLSIWWINGNQPVDKKNDTSKLFVIKRGEAVREIGNLLKKEQLIRDPVAFFILVKLNGDDKNIQAGDYKLSSSMNLKEIVDTLNHGTLDIWVTIPEGIRAEEIGDILKKEIPSYEDSWREVLNRNEGYLFPDTYLIPRDASSEQVVSILRGNFDKKTKDLSSGISEVNFKKAIIIASLIEREAKAAKDMRYVSSVIHNRLNIGMRLQIDATVQYAVGDYASSGKWWKQNLSLEDLKIDSPYNTYTRIGLPPTAIGNPGLVSIDAALNPVDTDYLYYVSDKNGSLHFASTLDKHNDNVNRYLR